MSCRTTCGQSNLLYRKFVAILNSRGGSTRHDLSCWWNVLCGSFREDFVHFQTNLSDFPYPAILRADAKTYTHFQGCKMSFILHTANPQDDQFQNKLAQKL